MICGGLSVTHAPLMQASRVVHAEQSWLPRPQAPGVMPLRHTPLAQHPWQPPPHGLPSSASPPECSPLDTSSPQPKVKAAEPTPRNAAKSGPVRVLLTATATIVAAVGEVAPT